MYSAYELLYCRIPLTDSCALGKIQVLLWLEAEVQDKLKELFGMDMQTGHKFLRVHIRGKVYHSLEYKRTKKRNSHTVCYSSDNVEKFGFIMYFISLSGSTVAVLYHLVPSPHHCYPPEISVLQSRIIPLIPTDDIDIVCFIYCKQVCMY